MKRLLSGQLAGDVLLASMILLLIMHVLVLLRIIPYEIVWGGQIKDASSLYAYESVALIITLLFIAITAIKTGRIKAEKLKPVARIGLYIMFAYFILNTVGNFTSDMTAERQIFMPLSVVFAILSLRVAVEK